MKTSFVGVLLIATVVAATPPVTDDELASKILRRASRSVEGTSFINVLDDFLFLFRQGTSSVGSELLNNVLFTMDFVTPSFDYVMDSVYGRGYRLNEKYKKYVQMYMTEDQIADHNHLLKIFKEQFNGDYDRYLQSGISAGDLYGTTQPISQSALDYLGRTITGNFPPGQQYTQQQLASGVASVLQGLESPSNIFYIPQQVPAVNQHYTPNAPDSENLPKSGWRQDSNGAWYYVTYIRNQNIPRSESTASYQPVKPPGPPPVASYEYRPISGPPPAKSPGSYAYSSGQPRTPSQASPQGSYVQNPQAQQSDPKRQMYSHSSDKASNEFPYQEYVVSSPRFPPLSAAGDNFASQQVQRPGTLRGLGQPKNAFQPQRSQEQSSYTSYEISDADATRSDLTKMYPPAESSPNFLQNETGKSGLANTEGIPENFLDAGASVAQPQSFSTPKSRKKRLAELYQSDLPQKVLFCPPENLKLVLCAGDIAIDVFLVKPVLYVLSWFV